MALIGIKDEIKRNKNWIAADKATLTLSGWKAVSADCVHDVQNDAMQHASKTQPGEKNVDVISNFKKNKINFFS